MFKLSYFLCILKAETFIFPMQKELQEKTSISIFHETKCVIHQLLQCLYIEIWRVTVQIALFFPINYNFFSLFLLAICIDWLECFSQLKSQSTLHCEFLGQLNASKIQKCAQPNLLYLCCLNLGKMPLKAYS